MRSRRTTPLPQPAHTKQEEVEQPEQWDEEGEEEYGQDGAGDDAWVDEGDYPVEEEYAPRSGRVTPRAGSTGTADGSGSSRNGARRRFGSRRPTYASSSPRKSAVPPAPRKTSSATLTPKVYQAEAEVIQREPLIPKAVIEGIQDTCYFIGKEVFQISALILRWLRIPIALFVVFLLLTSLLGMLTPTIRRTVRPLCIIPGISSSTLCLPLDSGIAATKGKRVPKRADYSALVNIQSKTFEQLLEDAAGGPALSLEIKKAEMATTDLVVRVRISNLKSKEVLATTLDEFVADAMKTGRGLQKLTAKVGGAVDK